MENIENIAHNLDSPALFIQNYLKIIDKRGQFVNFILNPQQKQLLADMDKFNVVLKSRQLGITVLGCAYSIWLAIRYPNTSCLLMAHSLDGADGIFTKLKQLYDSIPGAIRPKLINNNRKELRLENGSKIAVVSFGAKAPTCGNTYRFVHISEVAFCNENIDKQILAIEQCLTPDGQIVMESTANGFNFFSKMYLGAVHGENKYKPFFFGWVEDKLMFKDEYEWSTKRYIDLHGELPTLDELDCVELALYYRGASIEQLVWQRLKICSCSDGFEQFAQEFPSMPYEAFASKCTT